MQLEILFQKGEREDTDLEHELSWKFENFREALTP